MIRYQENCWSFLSKSKGKCILQCKVGEGRNAEGVDGKLKTTQHTANPEWGDRSGSSVRQIEIPEGLRQLPRHNGVGLFSLAFLHAYSIVGPHQYE